jgi:catechol 2,3-dioxygenase-like lactoylglutathione lyase family enzyme
MEVLSSRVLVRSTDFERSFRFYTEGLGLHVYREWSSGSTRGWFSSSEEASLSCLAPRALGPARV